MKWIVLTAAVALAAACGDDDSQSIDPKTDDFTVSEEDRDKLNDAANNGAGAEGTYTYDEDAATLTFVIDSSTFDCDGPGKGTFVAEVITITETELVLHFEGDGSPQEFSRVDEGGSGIVGIWLSSDGFYIILDLDGGAQIFGPRSECQEDRPRNDENCLRVDAASVAMIIDGDLSDWSGVGSGASVKDPSGDHSGDDAGADFTGLSVAFTSPTIYVLIELPAGPSTSFQNNGPDNQGAYRLTVQGDNGLSEQATLYYSPDDSSWLVMGFSDAIAADAGTDGLEWSIDASDEVGEGFEAIDFIFFESLGAEGRLDEGECAYFDVPK